MDIEEKIRELRNAVEKLSVAIDRLTSAELKARNDSYSTDQLPLQPVFRDPQGTLRFKANGIVQALLDRNGFDLNDLAEINLGSFSVHEWCQFASLIGYSLCGFSELSYTNDEYWTLALREQEACEQNECKEPAPAEHGASVGGGGLEG